MVQSKQWAGVEEISPPIREHKWELKYFQSLTIVIGEKHLVQSLKSSMNSLKVNNPYYMVISVHNSTITLRIGESKTFYKMITRLILPALLSLGRTLPNLYWLNKGICKGIYHKSF